MNMTQLEYFLAICKYNNISKAATQLFISQPALSQQLIRLEKELGAALFIRRENSLMLTEIGEGFQESAKRILFEYNNSKSMIDDIRRYRDPADQVGHLSVAVTKTKSFIMYSDLESVVYSWQARPIFRPWQYFEHESNKSLFSMC